MVTTTSSPSHLIAPATFPSIPDQLSVLSYNVLLPNSQDGWWNYKMYQPSESDIHHISSWEYRSQLLHDRIKLIDPDVVCMQEVSPLSFEVDFQFMNGLGYDGAEMFLKEEDFVQQRFGSQVNVSLFHRQYTRTGHY
mmetsp:Transcript_1272/g.1718  ORF Transcript_1272/g.1718 Transcript_1272/m.1718 type:complete len:137 (+) Transcript_1272:120-530(+)